MNLPKPPAFRRIAPATPSQKAAEAITPARREPAAAPSVPRPPVPAVATPRPAPRPALRPTPPLAAGTAGAAGQGDLFAPQKPAPAASQPAAPATAARPKGMALGKLSSNQAGADHDETRPSSPPAPTYDEVTGRVSHVIYETADGYAVYAVKDDSGKDCKVSVTSAIKAKKGDKIVAKGTWGTYKGQPNFKAVMIMHAIPKGARGVVTWIRTKAAGGVGKATAEKLAKHFGDRLPDVVGDADALEEAGIGRKKAEAIAEAWNSNAGQPELVEFLGRFGVGEMTIAKIVKRYGAAARRIVRENPWALAETIDGIGFATADEIAMEAGHAKDSEKRLDAGVRYALDQKTGREGHCGLPVKELVDEAVRLLGVPRALVEQASERVRSDKSVVEDPETGLVYPQGLYRSEKELAERLERLLSDGSRIPEAQARAAVEAAVAALGVKRDDSQVEAAVMAVTNPLSIITGGPGTGKSTTQRVIVYALESLGKEVVLAAPTGRAAKRLAEVSGKPASTCHRLLSFSAEKGGFEFDASCPFEEDHIIIDEFSMVDVRLGQSFMDAVKKDGAVTIVGDVDQLPSVGAGQVLRDLIEAGSIPVARLRTVHRQAGDSGIVVAAARINAGENPLPKGDALDGFELLSGAKETGTPEALRRTVVDLMSRQLPEMGYDPIQDVQVLSAMRKGELGITVLNEELKQALNPADEKNSVEVRKRVFSVGDRVMHLRNDYAKKVYNGEVGTVVWTGTRKNDDNRDEPCFKVDYSGWQAFYGPADVQDVELSWAATVHKSQGCEFPVVIFVCPDAHRRMLTRNLLYTAVTRAKKLCVVVGHGGALLHAVASADVDRRFTGLSSRLAPAPESPNLPFG